MKKFLLVSAMTCAAVGIATSAATASAPPMASGAHAFVCQGEFNNLVISGDLVVPSNGSCDIGADSTVTGNVWVEQRALFGTSFGTTIDGTISGAPASYVFVVGADVGGNVVSRNGVFLEVAFLSHVRGDVRTTGTGEVDLNKNPTIDGRVMIVNGTSANPDHSQIAIENATVGGNVLLLHNQARIISLAADEIGGNLICVGNSQLSFVDPITVGGSKLGQCAGA